jgi:hypothetical protein
LPKQIQQEIKNSQFEELLEGFNKDRLLPQALPDVINFSTKADNKLSDDERKHTSRVEQLTKFFTTPREGFTWGQGRTSLMVDHTQDEIAQVIKDCLPAFMDLKLSTIKAILKGGTFIKPYDPAIKCLGFEVIWGNEGATTIRRKREAMSSKKSK